MAYIDPLRLKSHWAQTRGKGKQSTPGETSELSRKEEEDAATPSSQNVDSNNPDSNDSDK